MKKTTSWFLATILSLGLAQGISAQNAVVNNARVIVGNGEVIDNANILILGGRIIELSEEAIPETEGLTMIDAQGLTAMPGFIDSHRDVIRGDPDVWLQGASAHMREYLELGVTTLLSVDHEIDHLLQLRDLLEAREIEGPRIIVSGLVALRRGDGTPVDESDVKEAVREYAYAGADAIASVVTASKDGAEQLALSAARDEADDQGLMLVTHIETVDDMFAAVAGGSGYLTGTPHIVHLDEVSARRVVETGRLNAEYGLVMTSALSAPQSAGAGPSNARLLYDAGIRYGFGTGTSLPPGEALRHEIRALESVFSNEEIIESLTLQGAYAARRDDALGTLRLGRVADVILIDGNPLADLDDLYNVVAVVRSGRLVIDNR